MSDGTDSFDLGKVSNWEEFIFDQLKYGTNRHKEDNAPSDWLYWLWSKYPQVTPHLASFSEKLGEITDHDVFYETVRLIGTIGVDKLKMDMDKFISIMNSNFDNLPPRELFGREYIYDYDLRRFIADCNSPEANELRKKLHQ